MAHAKLDRRVRRTRTAILRALISLMREKGYDAVTVTDIIDRADVGRSTFYTHFTDKSDVLDESLDGLRWFLRAHRDTGGGRLFAFSLAMLSSAALLAASRSAKADLAFSADFVAFSSCPRSSFVMSRQSRSISCFARCCAGICSATSPASAS